MDKSKLISLMEKRLAESTVEYMAQKGVNVLTPSTDPEVREWAKYIAAQAIALTDSYYLGLIPEKLHFVQYREFLVADKKMPIEENQRQAQAFVKGHNKAIDELRNRIGGSDG